ncbi:MAG: hydrogenase accessory protein HypB [Gammaproteobacteria bacterium]|nr:hydrogenase accessory protein HypB [Gammaproteobacteria bacterium]
MHFHVDETETSVLQSLVAENNRYADDNRQFFKKNDITAVHLVSSPGSGKTTLLMSTLNRLQADHALAVIAADQDSEQDSKRIAQTGISVKQINTGQYCHLNAKMVHHALKQLPVAEDGFVFIEDVGNLVVPEVFDLGESYRVLVWSITEGEDKPIKYPAMFEKADLIFLNKIDLLPHLNFNSEKCLNYLREINPKAAVLTGSAATQEGMCEWVNWLEKMASKSKTAAVPA